MFLAKFDHDDAPGPPPCSNTIVVSLTDARLVVVQAQIVADLRETRGGLVGELFCCSHRRS